MRIKKVYQYFVAAVFLIHLAAWGSDEVLMAPRAPHHSSAKPPQQEQPCACGTVVTLRDGIFRRLDVDLLVAKKQITQTDVIVTGTFFTGSIVSSGPISGSSLTISGPAAVGSLTAGSALLNQATIHTLTVTNPIVGTLSGAASLNVLKTGDTMTGQLRVDSLVGAAAVLRGLGTTQTPALQLLANPTATNTDNFLAIDSSGNVTQTGLPVQVGMLANATSSNVPNTLVQRDAVGSFEANVLKLQGLDVVGTSTFRDRMYLLFQDVSPNNILYVQKSAITAPNQFNSIKAAMDTITTNSANNPFVIRVTPGVYVEDTITMKPYTSIRGDTQGSVIIEASSPANDIIVACDNTYLRNFTMRGATNPGKAAISIDGGHLVMDMVMFESSDEFLKIRATSAPCSVILLNSEVGNSAVFSTAFDIQSTAGLQCGLITRNIFWSPTAPLPAGLTVIRDSGPGAFFIGSTLVLGNSLLAPVPGSGTKYLELSNGASAALGISLLRGFDIGVSVPATLVGPFLVLQGVVGLNNNTDISVQDQQTRGSIVGTFSLDKVSVNSNVSGLSVLITEPTDGGVGMVGPISTGRAVDTLTNLSPAWNDGTNLGLIGRGLIYTTTSSLVVTVSAGTGYLMQTVAGVDNLKEVDWQTTTTTLVPDTDNFLYINAAGQAQVSLSEPADLYTIFMGKIRASTVGALFVEAIHDEADHTGTKLNDTFTQAFGPIYIRGSNVSSSGLGLGVTSGQYIYGTHFFDPVGANPLTWQAYLGAGANEYLTTQTSVDYQQYDLNGTLTPMPFGYYAKHSLYVIGGVDALSGTSNEAYALVYSQTVFSTFNAATVGPVPTEPVTWTGNIVPIAAIVVKNDVSGQIAEILDERPRPGFVSSSVAGVTVHGNLLGLSADDHPQYLLVNGSRAMSGPLNMGTNQITNAGIINGVTIQSHASRHLPGSVLQDPLPMGVPVTIGTVNSLSQSGGVVNNFAYSDHVHAHGAQTDATLHAVATNVAAGFMSSADKQLLTNATPSNTPNTLVLRDAQGNFAAGTITAGLIGNVTGNVVGNVSGAASANVLKIGDTMTGQLRISDAINSALVLTTNATNPTASITGNGTTQAPALRLAGVPTLPAPAIAFDATGYALTMDFTGNVIKSVGNDGDMLRTFFSQPNWFRTVEPKRELFFYDDFTGQATSTNLLNYGDTVWFGDTSGTAASLSAPVPISNDIGVVQLNSGTTATSRVSMNKSFTAISFGKGVFVAEMRVRFNALSNGTQNCIARIGYGNTNAATGAIGANDFTNGVYFEYDFSQTTPNHYWRCKTAVSGGVGSPTVTTTTKAIVVDTWYTLRIEVNAAANSAKFYVDGVLVATNTTNIPTGANSCGAVAILGRILGTGIPNIGLLVDYWIHSYILTTLR